MFLCLTVLIYCNGNGQDIHYSQFFNSPLNLNPALTGAFGGEQRITANYKNQWNGLSPYNTFTAAYDRKLSPSDTTGFFSVGGHLNYDKAGDLGFQIINLGLSASYALKLNNNSYLSPGLQVGINSRNFDNSAATTATQFDGESFDPSLPAEMLPDNSKVFVDVSAGLNYRRQVSYRDYINAGVGLYHLLSPDQAYNSAQSSAGLDRRLSIYALGSFSVTNKLDLLPNILFAKQGSAKQEIVLNGQGKIYLNKNKERNIALYLGLGLRLSDAWYPMIAFQYKNYYGSFSYDITTSELGSAKGNGPEFAFRYLFYNVPLAPFKPCPIY